MLTVIKKVKVFGNQLYYANVTILDGDVVMMLLESLSPSHKNHIVAMETRPIHELTLDYVKSRLHHEFSERKDNESCRDNTPLLVKQSKGPRGGSSSEHIYYYCGKKGHINDVLHVPKLKQTFY